MENLETNEGVVQEFEEIMKNMTKEEKFSLFENLLQDDENEAWL